MTCYLLQVLLSGCMNFGCNKQLLLCVAGLFVINRFGKSVICQLVSVCHLSVASTIIC